MLSHGDDARFRFSVFSNLCAFCSPSPPSPPHRKRTSRRPRWAPSCWASSCSLLLGRVSGGVRERGKERFFAAAPRSHPHVPSFPLTQPCSRSCAPPPAALPSERRFQGCVTRGFWRLKNTVSLSLARARFLAPFFPVAFSLRRVNHNNTHEKKKELRSFAAINQTNLKKESSSCLSRSLNTLSFPPHHHPSSLLTAPCSTGWAQTASWSPPPPTPAPAPTP